MHWVNSTASSTDGDDIMTTAPSIGGVRKRTSGDYEEDVMDNNNDI